MYEEKSFKNKNLIKAKNSENIKNMKGRMGEIIWLWRRHLLVQNKELPGAYINFISAAFG